MENVFAENKNIGEMKNVFEDNSSINEFSEVVNSNEDKQNLSSSVKDDLIIKKNSNAENNKPKDKIKILKEPKRILPELITEVLSHKIPVTLSENGYLIGGFYGLNKTGFVELFDTENDNQLVAYDNKKKLHIINSFEDLVKFNATIWKAFYNEKKSEYLDASDLWLDLLTKYKCVRSVPL